MKLAKGPVRAVPAGALAATALLAVADGQRRRVGVTEGTKAPISALTLTQYAGLQR